MPPVPINNEVKYDIIRQLYEQIWPEIVTNDTVICHFATLIQVIVNNDGSTYGLDNGRMLWKELRKNPKLAHDVLPFLRSNSDKCVCGHGKWDHDGRKNKDKPAGHCTPADYNRGKEPDYIVPCKMKCTAFVTRPLKI